jgi:hypothetical protein
MAKKTGKRPGRPPRSPEHKHVVVSITLPPASLRWVDKQAKSGDLSRSAVIQCAIEVAMKGGRHGR